jgi:arylsulfatase A-like enzyme
VVALAGVLALGVFPSTMAASGATSSTSARPNILLILVDDQRAGTLWAMPNVTKYLVDQGVNFTHGYVVNPDCCPSRTTILTGLYSHGTGIYNNRPPDGGFAGFHDSSTIATWLQADGYRTALIGKYLNGYTGTYIPPGWDQWIAFDRGGDNSFYYNYPMNVNGVVQEYRKTASDYSTGVLTRDALDFIRSTPTSQPFFLYLAMAAPHLPAKPATRYADAFSGLKPWDPPGFNQADVSRMPNYVQAQPLLTPAEVAHIRRNRLMQLRTLLSVDDSVGQLIAALRESGRLSNTLIIYASDNGFMWGEHRRKAKMVPYEPAIRVPIVVRYDPLTQNKAAVSTDLALNLDFAPTFAAAAGVSPPYTTDGQSLLPLLTDPGGALRSDFLIEHLMNSYPYPPARPTMVPTYCALHTQTMIYVYYYDGEQELYDLATDPYELHNLAGDPAWSSTDASMYSQLKRGCQPAPPGLTFP